MNAHVKPDSFASAFIKLQAAIKPAIKDATNPAFRSKYADLGAVWEAVREPLATNGFGVIQAPQFEGETMFLETILLHESGEKMTSRYPLKPAKQDPQGFGSAITYAKRYALSAMLGVVADEDDDGNAASNVVQRQSAQPAQAPAPKPTDADIAAGARNWVDKQKDLILSFSDMDQLTEWLKKKSSIGGREGNWDRPTPSSDLDKILKHSAPLFNELKKYYFEKLREV